MIDVNTQMEQRALLQQTFPDLTRLEIEGLEKAAATRLYQAETPICRQGDLGETLFILIKGEAEIYIEPDAETQLLVRKIHPPTYFGEMALFGQISRSATVRAASTCQTLEIERETFVSLVEGNRVFLTTLSNQINDHLYNNDQAMIEELRRKNEALRTAYNNLAEQDRLRTEFISTLSHELRTPLTSVRGFLHLINNGAARGQSLQTAMDSVNRNVEKMVRLTNNLLVLYEMHLSEPMMASLSVAELLIEAMQEARSMQGDYLTPIALTMYPGATQLQGDRSSLSLVLRSLIENALKFSPDSTPITITVSKPRIDELCIEIADQGVGMSEEMMEHIFDPYFRGDEGDEPQVLSGLGVGLAITRFIMRRHGGRIEVDSKPEKGTAFRLFLPHTTHAKARPSTKILEKGPAKTNGFRAGVYAVAATP